MRDEYAEHWIARAKTPRTRARIRRWSKVEHIFGAIMITGMLILMALIPVAIGLGLWFWIAGIDRPDVFLWMFGIALSVFLIGLVPEVIADDRLSRASFADGYCSIGVIDEVRSRETTDGEGSLTTEYTLVVTSAVSDGLTLRRHLTTQGGGDDHPDEAWIGKRVRFRHNTLDPDDLFDEQFAGWPDRDQKAGRNRRPRRRRGSDRRTRR